MKTRSYYDDGLGGPPLFWALLVIVALVALVLWPTEPREAQAQSSAPRWECSLDDVGATLTRCISAPTGGEARYVTDIIAQSTTLTAGVMLIRQGTGSNCGTATVSVFPAAAAVPRFAYQGNGLAPTTISLATPLRVPPDKDICIIATAVNTIAVQLVGYYAP